MKTKTNLSAASLTLAYNSKVYNGKALKPAVTVKIGSSVVSASYYTVAYTNNKNPGVAKVTITAKSGNIPFTGAKSKTFKIAPKAPAKLTLKAGKKQVKITIKKAYGATGYIIYRSTKKNSGYKKIATTKKTSYTNKKLTSKKKYYYKVKTYKKSGSTTIYSAYSKPFAIKAK